MRKSKASAAGAATSASPSQSHLAAEPASPGAASPPRARSDAADADLLALIEQWRAAQERSNALFDRTEDLRAAMERPPLPDALIRRLEDVGRFPAPFSVDSPYSGGSWIAAEIASVGRREASAASVKALNRLREIETAINVWRAAYDEAERAIGLPEAKEESSRALEESLALERRVAGAPARTLAGVLAKLAATAAALGRDYVEKAAQEADDDHPLLFEQVVFSALRDLRRFAPPSAASLASPKRRAKVDPLEALGDDLAMATANYNAISAAKFEAAFKRAVMIVDKIIAAPATTIEGLRVKAQALRWCYAFEPIELTRDLGETTDVRVLASIARDLLAPH